jgi:NAD(P)H-hydrate epimerase
VKPILTPDEAAALDRAAAERGIAVGSLMERAGWALARVTADAAGGRHGRRAVVVCGKGNNGGDGLVAARHLARWGLGVTVVSLQDPAELREPAAANARRLAETDARVVRFAADRLARELGRADVAVDAIFGTGFRGIPEDDFATAIELLAGDGVPVVAADIPSGVNGSTGAVEGIAVRAVATVCFGALKPGVVLHPGAEHAGVVEVADIGFPADLLASDLAMVEAADVAAVLPSREPDTHKRATGVVLVVGASRGMTGAVCLTAEAAYRVGAGLVTVAVPGAALASVQAHVREATFLPLPETDEGTVAEAGVAAVKERLEDADAVALGPGLTTRPEASAFARAFVRETPAPVVLDADGLNAFAGRAADLRERRADLVLTPHAGEFARLAETSSRHVQADRIGSVRSLAASTGAVVLLKGSRTLVGTPDGRVRVNPTGTPALATAGSGDVLTGAIAGLMARGLDPADATTAGAFVHGLAGSLAGLDRGEGTTAGDVLDALPDAIAEVARA